MTATTGLAGASAPGERQLARTGRVALADLRSESMLIGGRALRHFVRSPSMLVATFGFPLLQLFILLAAFQVLIAQTVGESYVDRLAPFIILTTAFSAIGSSAIEFWSEIRGGVFTRFRTMPINALSVLVGRMLGDLARILAIGALVAVIAHLVGFRFAEGVPAALGFFALVAVFGVMCTSIGIVAALSAPHPPAIMQRVQLPSLVFFFLSSGYMPISAFPGWVQPVVRLNPVSLASEALMGLSSGGPVLLPALGMLGWAVGISAICGVVMVRRFRGLVAG